MRTLLVAASAGAFLAGVAGAAPPLQHGAAQGVRVAVYSSGTSVFDLRRIEPTPRRLLSGPSGLLFGCVKARVRSGLWRTSEYTLTGRFRRQLVFHYGNFKPPYDGCELGGLYGHRWDDAFGTRNAVEIWLTPNGRHFFNDRAAARDLAYFVRSRKVQLIRMSDDPRTPLEALVRRYAQRKRIVEIASARSRVRKDQIGFWIGTRTIVFTVTSSTGRRFYVVAERGTLKLPVRNLGELALVF